MRYMGRSLQMLALIMLPMSILLQLTDLLGRQLYVSEMVIMLIFGIAAFSIGHILEGYARNG